MQVTSEGMGREQTVAWLDDGRLFCRNQLDAHGLWAVHIDTSSSTPRIDAPVAMHCAAELEGDGKRLLVAVPADGSDQGVVQLRSRA